MSYRDPEQSIEGPARSLVDDIENFASRLMHGLKAKNGPTHILLS